MKRGWFEILAYIVVGAVSVLLAIFVATQMIVPAQSQEPPHSPPPTDATNLPPATIEPETPAAVEIEASSAQPEATNELPFLEPYNYNPEGRRDPFEPFSSIQVGMGVDGPAAGPMLPLQQYDLNQIDLIGIMWDVRDPKAMFLDPNKEVHTLRRNDRVGRNNGYIAVIREGEVVVVETARIRGELLYTTRVLKIARK